MDGSKFLCSHLALNATPHASQVTSYDQISLPHFICKFTYALLPFVQIKCIAVSANQDLPVTACIHFGGDCKQDTTLLWLPVTYMMSLSFPTCVGPPQLQCRNDYYISCSQWNGKLPFLLTSPLWLCVETQSCATQHYTLWAEIQISVNKQCIQVYFWLVPEGTCPTHGYVRDWLTEHIYWAQFASSWPDNTRVPPELLHSQFVCC